MTISETLACSVIIVILAWLLITAMRQNSLAMKVTIITIALGFSTATYITITDCISFTL